jgi:hypothetical protein
VREFPDVVVFSGGQVSASRADEVARAVGRVLADHDVVGGARVRLKTGRCGRGPMILQANLTVRDASARVQAVTAGIDDPLPALDRLDRHIGRLDGRRRLRPWPDLTRRMLTMPADAVLVRHKSVVPQRITPMEAAWVMDAMDYDAHLFVDAETGEDAVVYRAGPSGLRLARQRHVHPPGWSQHSEEKISSAVGSPPVPLIVNSRPAPELSEEAAVDRAHEHGPRLLFFTDPVSGRGRLLYPRYDGNLGLISPAGVSHLM